MSFQRTIDRLHDFIQKPNSQSSRRDSITALDFHIEIDLLFLCYGELSIALASERIAIA